MTNRQGRRRRHKRHKARTRHNRQVRLMITYGMRWLERWALPIELVHTPERTATEVRNRR